jgi:hypothetical protein
MHAIVGELTAPTVSEDLMSKDLFGFDIAVVGGGFHHFTDPELAAKRRKFFISYFLSYHYASLHYL